MYIGDDDKCWHEKDTQENKEYNIEHNSKDFYGNVHIYLLYLFLAFSQLKTI